MILREMCYTVIAMETGIYTAVSSPDPTLSIHTYCNGNRDIAAHNPHFMGK